MEEVIMEGGRNGREKLGSEQSQEIKHLASIAGNESMQVDETRRTTAEKKRLSRRMYVDDVASC